jgi:cyanophycin synthetase
MSFMKIEHIQVLSGPNCWSTRPCIQMRLNIGELEELPTNKIDGFASRIKEFLPSMHEHRCSIGEAGGFFQRIDEGTWMGHVVEHVALELQTLAGMDTGYGRTRQTQSNSTYNVVFSYIVSEAGKRSGELSVQFCEDLIKNIDPNLNDIIIELKELREKYKLGPSTSSIVDEAVKRDIPFFRLNRGSFVQLGYGKNQERIRATMTGRTSSIGVDFAQDKFETKDILEQNGIPVPKGYETRSLDDALKFSKRIGYPLVVKPSDGNHGRGITVGVLDDEHFLDAFDTAKKQSNNGYVIVEQLLNGHDFRFLVVNGKLVAAAQRVPAHVIGNGKNTIKELVDIENENPLRGYGHENILTEIDINHQTERLIADAGYSLDSILPKNKLLYLKTTANLSTGGTAVDILNSVHPSNIHIAERAIKIIGLDIGGVDIVAENVTTPLTDNGGGIVEINAAPGFRMHLQPTKGLARNVAEPVIDMLFPPGKHATIPIIAITGTNGKTTTTRLVNHICKMAGYTVGMCTTEGVYIKNRLIYPGDMTGPMSHKMVLQDPTVEMAILECARGGILRAGIGFRYCDVGVVTNVSEDHLGLRGIHTVEQLARVKQVIPKVVKHNGTTVLNADDPLVAKMANETNGKIVYFSMKPNENKIIQGHLEKGKNAVVYDEGWLCLMKGFWKYPLCEVSEVPITYDGKASFNIENALAAIAATMGAGIKQENIIAALTTFFPSYSQTPGRLTAYDMGEYKVFVDYAHNVAGYNALTEFVTAHNSLKSVITLSLPGDRRDEDFEKVAEVCAKTFNHFILFEDYHRGTNDGEISNLLKEKLLKNGINKSQITIILNEKDAVLKALEMGGEFDVVVLSNYNIDGTNEIVKSKKSEIDGVIH